MCFNEAGIIICQLYKWRGKWFSLLSRLNIALTSGLQYEQNIPLTDSSKIGLRPDCVQTTVFLT